MPFHHFKNYFIASKSKKYVRDPYFSCFVIDLILVHNLIRIFWENSTYFHYRNWFSILLLILFSFACFFLIVIGYCQISSPFRCCLLTFVLLSSLSASILTSPLSSCSFLLSLEIVLFILYDSVSCINSGTSSGKFPVLLWNSKMWRTLAILDYKLTTRIFPKQIKKSFQLITSK